MILTDEEIQQAIGGSLEVFMGIKHNLPKILRAQLRKVLTTIINEDKISQSPFPFYYAVSKDVMRDWFKEIE